MDLQFKPDLTQALSFWDAFWAGSNRRPAMLAELPRPSCRPVEQPPYLAPFDGDLHQLAHRLIAWGETHQFLGDKIPIYYLEFGPDTFAAYLGCRLILAEDRATSWSVPFVEDWDRVEIHLQRESYWWQRTLEAIHILRSHLDGLMLVTPPTLVANLDSLAAMRGPQALLFDLIERPEQVQRALAQVCQAHREILSLLAAELDMDRDGSVNLEGVYSRGRQSRPQCDFSAMISPAMFRRFVVPCLESEGRDASTMTYHLDGPGAIGHLPALCEIPSLDIISWVWGTGNEAKDWDFLYDRIDRLGKGQMHTQVSPARTRQLWAKYRSRKLVCHTEVSSPGEFADLLGELEHIEKAVRPGGGQPK